MRAPGGPEPDVPADWDYNPSSWRERLPLIGVALVGFGIATYLSAYQLGLSRSVWDPFFGAASSERILTSSFSRVLPIPDAALGAIGYLLDAVTGAIGGAGRWRGMPWIVVLFGVAVGPLGATSLFLVIAQPVVFDAWCALCLASAVISISMIGPAMDEVLASLQHLRRVSLRRESVWRAFWGLSSRQQRVARR
jgi:uncharacterized membrane protein